MKTIHSLMILFLMSGLTLTGCFEQSAPNIVYVNVSFSENTDGWDFDHFDSIQNAVDHCSENASIYVSNGLYTGPIFINKTLSLIGSDANETVIMGSGTDFIVAVSSHGLVNISGFTIRDSGKTGYTTPSKYGIKLVSNENKISGNIFVNNSCGVLLEFNEENTISSNLFVENDYGVYLYTGSDSNTIQNNVFYNNHIGGRFKGAQYNIVTKNIFSDNDGGLYFCCVSNDNVIFSNVFLRSSDWHAEDWCLNIWNTSETGNFWDDFYLPSQGAFDDDSDGFIDEPYNISRGYMPESYPNKDYLPLVSPPKIPYTFVNIDGITTV